MFLFIFTLKIPSFLLDFIIIVPLRNLLVVTFQTEENSRNSIE